MLPRRPKPRTRFCQRLNAILVFNGQRHVLKSYVIFASDRAHSSQTGKRRIESECFQSLGMPTNSTFLDIPQSGLVEQDTCCSRLDNANEGDQ